MINAIPNAIIKYSPAVRMNESLRAATKSRREALGKDHYLAPIDGFGVFHAIAPTDVLARMRTEKPVKRAVLACSAAIAAIAQAVTHVAAGPLIGAYVLAVWLVSGKEKMLDCAAKHLLPVLGFVHFIEMSLALGCMVGLLVAIT